MSTSMKDVPPEVWGLIFFYVAPEDYLKVKLVSKRFSDWATAEFKWKDMTKAEVVRGHTSLEAGLPRGRRLQHFVCTHCGLVKPTNAFSDNQAVKKNHTRICISCGIIHRRYTKGVLPKINGEEHIPCWRCKQAVPKYDNWEEVMASGKADLAKFMDGSKTGKCQSYNNADGRTLDWVFELEALAFCRPCLQAMIPYKQKAPRAKK